MSTHPSEELANKERYELAREHVRREDDLVNFRTTWFLAAQALLFTAFFQIVGLGDAEKLKAFSNPRLVMCSLALTVTVAAIATAIGWAVSVRLALRQIAAVEVWLEAQKLPTGTFPPLRQANQSAVNPPMAAFVVSAAWVALLWATLAFVK